MSNFNLIMISAGFEQGGNTLQRFLDGHPQLFVYPFESMLGSKYSSSILDNLVHYKYRWPEFKLDSSRDELYNSIYDEELKTYLRTPERSKFKNCGMKIDEKDRKEIFFHDFSSLSRAKIIELFFESTFKSWKNLKCSDEQSKKYVGYSPTILLDTDKILKDFPYAKIIHIVRNPWSGYGDTLKRPFPQSLQNYCKIWNILQFEAINYSNKYKDNFMIVSYESLINNKEFIMEKVAKFLNIENDKSLLYPSFNGKKLNKIYPWGTIEYATKEENKKSAMFLSDFQRKEIMIECSQMLAAHKLDNYI